MTSQPQSPAHAAQRNRARAISFALLLVALTGCASPPSPAIGPGSNGSLQSGLASWYSDALHGRPTASGEPYDRGAMTGAHKKLPFGSVVQVTRTDTGQRVVVTINDRGPFVEGRIIDLSRRAAEELDMIEDGVVPVRIAVID
jgi:rare lipoprotein A